MCYHDAYEIILLTIYQILVSYFKHIRAVWAQIVLESQWRRIDYQTATYLELLAPGVSSQDRKYLKDGMLNMFISPKISDDYTRAEVLRSLLAFKGLVPSIRIFFENQKYLEPYSGIRGDLLGAYLKGHYGRSTRPTTF